MSGSNYGQGGYGRSGYTDSNPYAQQDNFSHTQQYNSNPYQQQDTYGQQQGYGQPAYSNPHQGNFRPAAANPPHESYEMTENPQNDMADLTTANDMVDAAIRKMERVRQLRAATLKCITSEDLEMKEDELRRALEDMKNHNVLVTRQIIEVQRAMPGNHAAARLKTRYQEAMRDHNAKDQQVLNEAKERSVKTYMSIHNCDREEAEQNATVGGQAFHQAMMKGRRQAATSALSEAQARQREIQSIAETMEQLADLFAQMNEMVVQQEEKVEAIQSGAEQTHQDLEAGVKELDVAKDKARSARRKKWWCLLIVVILIVIIIIVVMVTVVRPIIQESNNNSKRSLEYIALARRSILDSAVSMSSHAHSGLLE